MKSTLVALALGALLVTAPACTVPPPTLTPAAATAYQAHRIQAALDLIRDAVDDGTRTTPPLFSIETDVQVATWHEAAITVIHAGGAWAPSVRAALVALPSLLTPAQRALVAPYVALADALLAEVH